MLPLDKQSGIQICIACGSKAHQERQTILDRALVLLVWRSERMGTQRPILRKINDERCESLISLPAYQLLVSRETGILPSLRDLR